MSKVRVPLMHRRTKFSLDTLTPFGLLLVAAASGLFACDGETAAERVRVAELAASCILDSDCEEPLVCAYERCHSACDESRDCPSGARCIGAGSGAHVCQLPEETACQSHADCPASLLCGVDGQCRDVCQSDDACLGDQLCVSGTCAEREELDEDGELPRSEIGLQTCALPSDCSSGQRCHLGRCIAECLEDVDCGSGRACVEGACRAAEGTACASDDDCERAGEHCDDGACRCQCVGDVDCSGGLVCDGCACVEGSSCERASDCDEPGQDCVEGACRCECVGDIDCAPGFTCGGCACVEAPPTKRVLSSAAVENSFDLLALRGVTEISGALSINASAISSLSDLRSLEKVGYLWILNTKITSLEGLENLVQAQAVHITQNTELTDVTALGPLVAPPVAASIAYNHALSACAAAELMSELAPTQSFVLEQNLPCEGTCNGAVCEPPTP